MTARKAAHSLQRAKGALASGFATVDLHHATGHDPIIFWLSAPKTTNTFVVCNTPPGGQTTASTSVGEVALVDKVASASIVRAPEVGEMATKPLSKSHARATRARHTTSHDVMTVFTVKRGAAKVFAGLELPDGAEIAIVSTRPETVEKIRETFRDRVTRVTEVVARGRGKSREKSVAVIDKSAFEPDARSRAVLAGVRIAQEDLREAGGAFDLDQVRTLMRGVSRQAVDKRVQEGSLIAVPGPSNRRSYPTVQFERDGTVVPGLKAVRDALRTTNPWTILNFLINPDMRLNARRPIDLLKEGDVATVVDAAERHGEQGA